MSGTQHSAREMPMADLQSAEAQSAGEQSAEWLSAEWRGDEQRGSPHSTQHCSSPAAQQLRCSAAQPVPKAPQLLRSSGSRHSDAEELKDHEPSSRPGGSLWAEGGRGTASHLLSPSPSQLSNRVLLQSLSPLPPGLLSSSASAVSALSGAPGSSPGLVSSAGRGSPPRTLNLVSSRRSRCRRQRLIQGLVSVFWGLMLLQCVGLAVSARVWVVSCSEGRHDMPNCGWEDMPCATIQHTVGLAKDGDTVEVLPGSCIGRGNKDIRLMGKRILLQGRNTQTVDDISAEVDCKGSGRGFIFDSTEGSHTVIRGLRVKNCKAEFGAAIFSINSAPIIEDCEFKDNAAIQGGGAIYWKVRGPRLERCRFSGNSAAYGADMASNVMSVSVPGFPRKGMRPGGFFDPPVIAYLLDHYGQVVTTTNKGEVSARVQPLYTAKPGIGKGAGSKAILEHDHETMPDLSGFQRANVIEGKARFPNLQLLCVPGKTSQVFFSYDMEEIESEALVVSSRNCVAGEEVDANGISCRTCPPGFFSGLIGTRCQECPIGAICTGGDTVEAMPGYFISSKEPLVVNHCPNPSVCLGGAESSCEFGYKGNMCQQCDNEWTNCFGKCVEGVCWPIAGLISGTICGVFSFAFLFLRISRESEADLVKSLVRVSRKKKLQRAKLRKQGIDIDSDEDPDAEETASFHVDDDDIDVQKAVINGGINGHPNGNNGHHIRGQASLKDEGDVQKLSSRENGTSKSEKGRKERSFSRRKGGVRKFSVDVEGLEMVEVSLDTPNPWDSDPRDATSTADDNAPDLKGQNGHGSKDKKDRKRRKQRDSAKQNGSSKADSNKGSAFGVEISNLGEKAMKMANLATGSRVRFGQGYAAVTQGEGAVVESPGRKAAGEERATEETALKAPAHLQRQDSEDDEQLVVTANQAAFNLAAMLQVAGIAPPAEEGGPQED